jgi:hypothetical protein
MALLKPTGLEKHPPKRDWLQLKNQILSIENHPNNTANYKFDISRTQSSEFRHSHQLHMQLSYSGCRFEELGDGLT